MGVLNYTAGLLAHSTLLLIHVSILGALANFVIYKGDGKCNCMVKDNSRSRKIISLLKYVILIPQLCLIYTHKPESRRPEGACIYIRQSTSACGISAMYHVAHAG